jgi:hypothetical protein
MQMVKRSLTVLLVLWLGFLVFMPKVDLYNTLQAQLAKQDIKLNEKRIKEGLFSLTLDDVTVYVKGIPLAHLDKVDFFTLMFYSKITIDNLSVDEVLHSTVPEHIQKATATYSLLHPWYAVLDANGSFGLGHGKFKFKKKRIRVDLTEVKKIEKIKSMLKKSEKGWFYEKTF